MVKNLGRYVGKTINVSFHEDGGHKFKSQLVHKVDEQGNNEYYIRTPEGKKRIYANGKKRVVMYGGILLILDQDRKWSDLVRMMNEMDEDLAKPL